MDNLNSIIISCIAEFIGTMLFVLCGTASTLMFDLEHVSSKESIAFAFGVIYALLVNITASFGGGYLNPAVTIAMVIRHKISPLKGACYVVVQCAGAILGSFFLKLLTPLHVRGGLGATMLGDHIQPISGVCVELVMTFVLVYTALICCDGNRKVSYDVAALWSGLAVTGCHLFGFHFTSCGMNPARSLGPAVITGIWHYHWVYWAGPISGALLASLVHCLTSNYPVTTNEVNMAVTGEALDLHNKALPSTQSEHEAQSDKVSDVLQSAADSPRFVHVSVPTEMKTCF